MLRMRAAPRLTRWTSLYELFWDTLPLASANSNKDGLLICCAASLLELFNILIQHFRSGIAVFWCLYATRPDGIPGSG